MSDMRGSLRRMPLGHVFLLTLLTVSGAASGASVAETDGNAVSIARSLLEKDGDVAMAMAEAKAIRDDRLRVRTLRRLAETQAARLDYYGKLSSDGAADKRITVPQEEQKTPSEASLRAFSRNTHRLAEQKGEDVIVRRPLASTLGNFIPDIPHPRRLGYDTAYVKKRMPAPTASFKAGMLSYELCLYNLKLVSANGHADFAERQRSANPQVVYFEEGVAGLAALHDRLAEQGVTDVIVKQGKTYTLRKPLVIGPKAALLITGEEVDDLRLSEERGAYIVNAGRLFVVETRVTGWREAADAPAVSNYANSEKFRPFIMSWSRSKTYLAGSVFTALGYSNSKSYGITVSAGPERMLRFRPERIKRPTAIIVDNSFRNLYYGFYCYEADNVALIGNEYVDNIVYGIDPHDYSRHLTIAYNTVYGSQKKHGIIISRQVNDSVMVGNICFENQGSGLMLERLSGGTLVYANTSFANIQDGMTVYESNCNISAGNGFFANGRMGVNVRNSVDVGIFYNDIVGNAGAGIQGYRSDLRADAVQKKRDFALDPYSDMVGFSAVGNLIEANDRGIHVDGVSALYLRANRFIHQSPHLFRGDWLPRLSQIAAKNDLEKDGVFITRRCSVTEGYLAPEKLTCGFRDQGYFAGDGQDGLAGRMQGAPCAVAATTTGGRTK